MQVPAGEVPDDLLEIIDNNPHDVFEIGRQGGTRLFELNLLGREPVLSCTYIAVRRGSAAKNGIS
jgi:hypothetical protein